MKLETIQLYFKAERAESLVFIAIGIIALAAGMYFLFSFKQPFYTGIAWPLIIIAVIQIFVGGARHSFANAKDVSRVETMYSTNNHALTTQEIPRMETVMKNFVVYRFVEIAVAAVGIILILTQFFGSRGLGIGTGLFIQALLMLAADYFDMKRGQQYLDMASGISEKYSLNCLYRGHSRSVVFYSTKLFVGVKGKMSDTKSTSTLASKGQ